MRLLSFVVLGLVGCVPPTVGEPVAITRVQPTVTAESVVEPLVTTREPLPATPLPTPTARGVTPVPQAGVTLLGFAVTDAGYSASLDRLVFLTLLRPGLPLAANLAGAVDGVLAAPLLLAFHYGRYSNTLNPQNGRSPLTIDNLFISQIRCTHFRPFIRSILPSVVVPPKTAVFVERLQFT
ncbi:MAG: hypothetical protein H6658_14455 [Ardenticatenaceae bacterium]|nr:hypothetical protein [Ardenticatenaceae bacterium]